MRQPDMQPVHLAVQRVAADTQRLRNVADVPAMLLEQLQHSLRSLTWIGLSCGGVGVVGAMSTAPVQPMPPMSTPAPRRRVRGARMPASPPRVLHDFAPAGASS